MRASHIFIALVVALSCASFEAQAEKLSVRNRFPAVVETVRVAVPDEARNVHKEEDLFSFLEDDEAQASETLLLEVNEKVKTMEKVKFFDWCIWAWNWVSCLKKALEQAWTSLGFDVESGFGNAIQLAKMGTNLAKDILFTGNTVSSLISLNPFSVAHSFSCASNTYIKDQKTPTCTPNIATNAHHLTSEEEAMMSAKLARLSYSLKTDADAAAEHSTLVIDPVHDVETTLFSDDDTLYIAFRGSVSITDWLVDLNLCPTTLNANFIGLASGWNCGGLMMHTGFQVAYLAIRDKLHTAIAKVSGAHSKVIVTGHSLGGAMAHLCAIDLIVNGVPGAGRTPAVGLVTFGQPELGNGQWAKFVDKVAPGYRRYAASLVDGRDGSNRVDLVSHCCGWITGGNVGGYGGYTQPSTSKYITPTGGFRNQGTDNAHRAGCETLGGVIALKKCHTEVDCVAFSVLCHMMQNYCSHWDALGSDCGIDAKYWNPATGMAAFN
jgi:hypothetical protein